MSSFVQGTDLRLMNYGRRVAANAYSLVTETHSLFTVAGGECVLTALWVKVGTTMTVANTLAVQIHPTTGGTFTLVTATDLGTTDTVAGSVIGVDASATAAPSFLRGGRIDLQAVVTTGIIELVTTGTSPDGAVTFFVQYVPLTDGATIVAV